jgi:hypothetical protein
MSEALVVGSVADAVACLEVAVDEVAAADLGPATDDELLELWQRLETVRRKLEPIDHAVVSEVETRSLPFRHACRNTSALARQVLRIGPGEAAARVSAAHRCGPSRAVTGEALPPTFPAVAAAQAAGQLSAQHARVIADAVTGLPVQVGADVRDTVERILVDFGRQHDPQLLGRFARELAYALDQDGQADQLEHRERTRGLTLHRRTDGSGRLEGELTPECAEHLAVHLDALGKPAPADRDGLVDQRTATQRRHDALLTMLSLVERADLLPHAGGCSATILLTMPAEAYATGAGTATTGHGYAIPAYYARQWAGPEARVLGTVFSRVRGIEAYSSTQRIFTEQQRLAIIARDRGCSFPGCDAPPQRCEVHHVTAHHHGGPTSVANAALVCSFHHRHFDEQGWTCTMSNGRPWWTPPKWLDPDQVPRRNAMHEHAADP